MSLKPVRRLKHGEPSRFIAVSRRLLAAVLSNSAAMLKEKVYRTWLHSHYVLHAQIEPKSLRVKNTMNCARGVLTSSRVRLTHLAQLEQLARQTEHGHRTQLAQLAMLPRRPSTPNNASLLLFRNRCCFVCLRVLMHTLTRLHIHMHILTRLASSP